MTVADPSGPLEQPGEASAESGQVVLDGPDGVAIAMTPDAAAETGRRLLAAAEEARRQLAGNASDVSGEG